MTGSLVAGEMALQRAVELTRLRHGPLHEHTQQTSRRFLAATLLAAVLITTSCDGQPTPINEWEVTWRNTVSTVEEASTPDVTQESCEDILAYLRVQRTVMSPVPLDDLENPVDDWFAEAEAIFFECDLADDATRASLETLRALEAEVETVLDLEG